MKNILLGVLVFVGLTSSLYAAEYYVDCVDGSNGNTGAINSKWATVAYASTQVSPGDTVNISSGNCDSVTFNSSSVSGTSDDSITYKGVTGTIFSSLSFSPTSNKSFYYDVKDLKIAGTYTSGYPEWTDTARSTLGPMISIGTGTGNVLLQNLEVTGYVADDGLPANYEGIRFEGGVADVVIDGLDLHTLNTVILAWGVATGGSGNVIKNTKIHDVMGSAIGTLDGLESITNTIISDEIPQAYNPSHPGGSGIAMRGGNITIDNVIIKNYGMTRPIRWYQDSAGADGYQNVNISNLLVYYTVDSVTVNDPVTHAPTVFPYNKYAEFIHVGNNFTMKNSTLDGGLIVFLATNNDGSGFSMFNNLINWLTLNNHYDSSANLYAQTCSQAFVKWDKVVENNNIWGSLTALGNEYPCSYNYFTPGSSSVKTGSFSSLFANTTQPNNDYRLSQTSQARDFGDAASQATTSMGHALSNGFVINGIARDSQHHSAGVYECLTGTKYKNVKSITQETP